MIYDVHAHCIPEGLPQELAANGHSYGMELLEEDGKALVRIAGRVKTPPFRADLSDLHARLRAMDEARVDVQLVSSWVDLTAYALPSAHARHWARCFNDHLAGMVDQAPHRFRGLANVPLQDPPGAVAEFERAVAELGMVGAEIATRVDGRPLDDPELEPFWAAAAETRALVLVHPYDSLAGHEVSRYFLRNLVGNPAESTLALGHLIFGGVLDRHPDLRLCVVHGGGFVPYQVGRLQRGFDAVEHLTRVRTDLAPAEQIRRLYFDTVLHDVGAIAHLVDLVGSSQVVLGTDYPFEMGDPTPVSTLESVPGLDPAQLEAIMTTNVERLVAEVRR